MCSDGSAGPESQALDGAGGARSIEKSDISSWHYTMVDLEEKLAGRDIRSKRTKEHRGGVSSRVVRTAVLGYWAVELELKIVSRQTT
jgi:hypothetical protein